MAKKVLSPAEKHQRRVKIRKGIGAVAVAIIDATVFLMLYILIVSSWLPTVLSITVGAIGISFASYLTGMTVLDFVLGVSILLFETVLWILALLKTMKLLHKGLKIASHKIIAFSLMRKGAK